MTHVVPCCPWSRDLSTWVGQKVNQTRLLQQAERGEFVELVRARRDCSFSSLCKFPEKCRRSSEPRSCRRGLCCRRRLHKRRQTRTSVDQRVRIRRTMRPCVLYFSGPTAPSRFSR